MTAVALIFVGIALGLLLALYGAGYAVERRARSDWRQGLPDHTPAGVVPGEVIRVVDDGPRHLRPNTPAAITAAPTTPDPADAEEA